MGILKTDDFLRSCDDKLSCFLIFLRDSFSNNLNICDCSFGLFCFPRSTIFLVHSKIAFPLSKGVCERGNDRVVGKQDEQQEGRREKQVTGFVAIERLARLRTKDYASKQ